MDARKLGRQGLEVSALGLGCMGMSFAYKGGADEAECLATLQEAVDRGVTLIDTAEVYGPYENEKLVGRALAGARRDRVCLATKFGFDIENMKPGTAWALDSRPEHIRAVVEQSLQRLQTDRIDLLYQHRVDPKVPIEEVVGAMGELVRQGKERLGNGRWVVIFPEGTRVPPGQTGRYGIGGAVLASASGYPVVPVAHNAGEFWPRRGFIKRPGVITVAVGPPIESRGKDPDVIKEEAKIWIEGQCREMSVIR